MLDCWQGCDLGLSHCPLRPCQPNCLRPWLLAMFLLQPNHLSIPARNSASIQRRCSSSPCSLCYLMTQAAHAGHHGCRVCIRKLERTGVQCLQITEVSVIVDLNVFAFHTVWPWQMSSVHDTHCTLKRRTLAHCWLVCLFEDALCCCAASTACCCSLPEVFCSAFAGLLSRIVQCLARSKEWQICKLLT